MAQKVYQGNDPYVFVSYSHKDKEKVFEIISDLMLCACNIWYDTGLHSGDDWSNEIAERLYGAECVLFMVTANSVQSEYVKDELNFAKAKNKKIYPIFLENVILPLSLELLLGRVQAISCLDDDVEQSRFKLREKIKGNLPTTVFQMLSDPFYVGQRHRFHLKDTSKPFPPNTYFEGEMLHSFEIRAVSVADETETTVCRLAAKPQHDMYVSLNNVAVFDDPYFCDDDSQVLFLSVALDYSGKYPVRFPDATVVLTIALSRLESDVPRATLVDYKWVGDYTEQEQAYLNSVVRDIEQAFVKNK